MKKLAAILMTVAVVAAMTGCAKSKETKQTLEPTKAVETQAKIDGDNAIVNLKGMKREDEPNMVGQVGGWNGNIEDLDINKNAEAKAALEKATSLLTGMNFEGIYLLGKQIVSGTNYCILCKGTATVPDAVPGYYLVYVYADLQGNAEVLKIDTLLEAADANVDGGWGVNTGDPAFANNAEVKAAYEKALASMVIAGGEMEPVAYLGCQVVGGYNYLVLCRVKAVIDDPTTELALVTIYVDPQGNASISTDDMNFSAQEDEEEQVEQTAVTDDGDNA